jgi:hypothetical protein
MEWKYRFFTHRQDFSGCLRLAQRQSLRQISKSTRCERLRCHDMPMIVHPAPDDRVELTYQAFLADGFVRIDDAPDFLQEHVRVLFRWLDEQFAVELAEMLSEEVEPLINMRDAGFLWRELQAPLARNCSTRGRTSFSSTSLVAPVMMKSSAYRMRLILD